MKSGLAEPAEWTVDSVSKRLEELVNELGLAKSREKTTDRIKELRKEVEKLEVQLQNIEKSRNEWLTKVKAAPEDYSGLYWFLEHLKKWQDTS